MSPDSTLDAIRKAFAEPNTGSVIFLTTLFFVALLVNHATGFTDHYDISSQIEHLSRLEKTSRLDSTLAEKTDSLKLSIIQQIEERQKSPTPTAERKARLMATLPIVILLIWAFWIRLREIIEEEKSPFQRLKDTAVSAIHTLIFPVVVWDLPTQGSLLGAVFISILAQAATALFILLMLTVFFPALAQLLSYIPGLTASDEDLHPPFPPEREGQEPKNTTENSYD